MPANLTPQFKAAEDRFRQAVTHDEKLEALQEMLSAIPKHKGTEKMQGDIKRRLARLRQEEEEQSRQGKRGGHFRVEKQGAGQVILLGGPNVGKSSLVVALTNAELEVADYPFTTHQPSPGMMLYENVQIQLVDAPPLTEALEQVEAVRQRLAAMHVHLVGPEPEESDSFHVFRRTLLVGNKADMEGATERLEVLRELYGEEFPLLAVSARTGAGLEEFRQVLWEFLHVIRVYTKIPNKKPDLNQPFVLPQGSTVLDLAGAVHRDFANGLKFARIWGTEAHDGQPVARDHVVHEGDVLELHL